MGKIRANLAGAGLLFAALMLLINGGPGEKAVSSYTFTQGLLWGVVFVGACCVAASLWRKESDSLLDAKAPLWIMLGAVLVAISTVVMWASPTAPFASGFLAGAACSTMGSLWLKECLRYDMADNVMSCAAALVLAGAARFVALSVFPAQCYVPTILVLTFASAGLFFFGRRGAVPVLPEDERGDESDQLDSAKSRAATGLKLLWLPVAGAMLSVFIFGLTWDPVVSGDSANALLPFYDARLVVAPCIAALAVTVVGFRGSSGVVFAMQGVLLPCAVAIILVLPVLGVDSTLLKALFQILQASAFSLIAMVTWVSLVAATRSTRLPSCAPLSFAVLALTTMVGMDLIHVIGLGGKDLCVLLLTVYMALIAVWYALETQREKTARVIDDLRPSAYISRRCDELEEEFGISQREKEVLYYLARGYNHGYIARKLFISENTVRTHVRHIYTKLDVNSREGLLDFIDGVDAEENAHGSGAPGEE